MLWPHLETLIEGYQASVALDADENRTTMILTLKLTIGIGKLPSRCLENAEPLIKELWNKQMTSERQACSARGKTGR